MKLKILKILFFAGVSLGNPLDDSEEKIPQKAPAEVDLVKLFAASIKLAEYGGQALVEAHTEKTINVLSNNLVVLPKFLPMLESNKRMSFSFPKLFPGVHVRSEEVTDEPIGKTV